jgi:hypothetical protein
MSSDQKVLIATLWHRISERGNEYLSGFLGKARIIGFRGEPTADGTPTWDLYVQPGKEQEEARGSFGGSYRHPAASQKQKMKEQRPADESKPAEDDQSLDDPIDRIGR